MNSSSCKKYINGQWLFNVQLDNKVSVEVSLRTITFIPFIRRVKLEKKESIGRISWRFLKLQLRN